MTKITNNWKVYDETAKQTVESGLSLEQAENLLCRCQNGGGDCYLQETADVKFNDIDCEISVKKYDNSNRRYILLISTHTQHNMSDEINAGECVIFATVEVPHLQIRDNEVVIKTYHENEGILDVLINAGVVELTGNSYPIGYVSCPIVKIIQEKS